jgi:hypothetical protein
VLTDGRMDGHGLGCVRSCRVVCADTSESPGLLIYCCVMFLWTRNLDSHTDARKLTGLFGNNVLTVLRGKIKCHEDEEYYTVTSDVICARYKIASKVEVGDKCSKHG